MTDVQKICLPWQMATDAIPSACLQCVHRVVSEGDRAEHSQAFPPPTRIFREISLYASLSVTILNSVRNTAVLYRPCRPWHHRPPPLPGHHTPPLLHLPLLTGTPRSVARDQGGATGTRLYPNKGTTTKGLCVERGHGGSSSLAFSADAYVQPRPPPLKHSLDYAVL